MSYRKVSIQDVGFIITKSPGSMEYNEKVKVSIFLFFREIEVS